MRASPAVGAFLLVATLGACSDGDVRGAERKLDEAHDAMTEHWEELKSRTADARLDLERELGELKDGIDVDLDALQQDARDATSSLRGDLEHELGELRREASELDERLEQLRASVVDEWDELRDDVVDRMQALRAELESARRRARG